MEISQLKAMNNFTQKKHIHSLNKKGFTLIEIMVSVAIFTIIMTTGIGALVSITNSYRESQRNKQVNDALNYSLESMTREIRLGTNYFSEPQNNGSDQGSKNDGSGDSLGFDATDSRGYIIFRHNENNQTLERISFGGTIGNNTAELTNSETVEIRDVNFTVIGTDTPGENGDDRQPLVWIQIQASSPGSDNISTVQTLVSQRLLDV